MQLDEKAFRNALGTFATGVTIVTTRGPDGEDVGLTANSFNSVSLDPPLVLWSLAKTSKGIEAFTQATHFAVHILAADQEPLSNQFAKRGIDKFAGVDLERGEGDIPLIKGCGARFQCRSAYQYEGGDHVILVGEVTAFEHDQRDPLLFYKGRYALATQRGEENGVPDSAAISDDDLSHLLQRAYFYLLTPVRRQRERHGISLHEHYLMSVLMASGGKTVDQINDIIGYTGVISTPEIADALVARGLVQKLSGDVGLPRLWLTPIGQRMMIEVIASGKAMEADALLDFAEDEKRLLKRLVKRLLAGAERSVDERVGNHMDLLKQITTNVRKTVGH